MAIDPELAKLIADASHADTERAQSALAQMTEMLQRVDEATRGMLKRRLFELVEADRTSIVASTAIWVIGKLCDETDEARLASLLATYVQDDRFAWHLYQTMIALDNIERVPAWGDSDDPSDPATICAVANAYLATKARPS